MERDAEAEQIARTLGWTPVVLWECELKADPQIAVRRVADASRVRTFDR
jgi:G:T-mismatch repair DNA endonuclease (very short patch repair protein)